MTESVLTMSGLRIVRAGKEVVHEIDIDVPAGQVTALLGPNGAGKSSTAAAVAGLIPVESGSITVNGNDITNGRADRIRAAGVSVVPEGRMLLTDLTVEDNLRVAAYSLGKSAAAEGLEYSLSLFPELKKRWDVGGRLLSGGEQQMLVLAQALLSRPKALVVDELSLGLAPLIVKRLVPVLAGVAAEGTAVLLIEQFAHVALELATSAYILESGSIRYAGTAAELQAKPDLLHSAYLLRD
jgi:branched-chain amino acid transport system ATP-binding protein